MRNQLEGFPFHTSQMDISNSKVVISGTTYELANALVSASAGVLPNAAFVQKGNWDASAGSFPGSGAALVGWAYRCSVAGTVNGVEFSVDDTITALVNGASSSVYLANWSKGEGQLTASEITDALGYEPANAGLIGRSVGVISYGASGSSQSTTGSITSGASILTIAAGLDFADGQGIRVNNAGAACAVNAPTGLGVVPTGTTGATTYSYQVSSIGVDGAISAATSAATITNGNATLSATNYNTISWTAPASGTAPVGYAIWGNASGATILAGVVQGGATVTWNDYGKTTFNGVTTWGPTLPDWMPATPPASALASFLVAEIVSGAGTTTLTLDATANTTASVKAVHHDDSVALSAAITAAMTARGGVYIPSGDYRITSQLPLITAPISIIGDGSRQTRLLIDPAMSGDGLRSSMVWYSTYIDYTRSEVSASNMLAGLSIRGIAIWGSRASPYVQNGVMFYDVCDRTTTDDVQVMFMTGRGLGGGIASATAFGCWRESSNRGLILNNCGSAGVPQLEIYSEGTGDASNEVHFDWCESAFPFGEALRIHNANTSVGVRKITFRNAMIHGQQSPTHPYDDLVVIGSDTLTGIVSYVDIHGHFDAGQTGYSVIRTTSPDAASQPYNCKFHGSIGAGDTAIKIDAGRLLCFDFTNVATTGTNDIVIAASPLVGSQLDFVLPSNGQSLTWSIDSSATKSVRTTPRSYGNPSDNSAGVGFSLHTPDSAATGGNARGAGAVDMQTARGGAAQVASGTQAFLGGGSSNTASGLQVAVLGGLSNNASGTQTLVWGRSSADDGRVGGYYFSGHANAVAGDSVASGNHFAAITTDATPTQLTVNGSAAGSTNIHNLSNDQTMRVTCALVGRDASSGDSATYEIKYAIKRGANAAATALVGSPTGLTADFADAGAASWGSPTVAADTTNGGANISVTGKAATTIVWSLRIDAIAVIG